MHRFDYQFLADNLPANLLEIAGIIYDLRGKGEIRKMNNLHLFEELQHTAMVDSIQSSLLQSRAARETSSTVPTETVKLSDPVS